MHLFSTYLSYKYPHFKNFLFSKLWLTLFIISNISTFLVTQRGKTTLTTMELSGIYLILFYVQNFKLILQVLRTSIDGTNKTKRCENIYVLCLLHTLKKVATVNINNHPYIHLSQIKVKMKTSANYLHNRNHASMIRKIITFREILNRIHPPTKF